MTWEEIKQAIDQEIDTVIVVIGSVEQHGPHLPTITDTLIGEILGERIAREINALLAPLISVGCSSHHKHFPGTITLQPSTLMQVIQEYCQSLSQHGFKNIVLLPIHGGNFPPVNTIAPEIARNLRDKASIIPIANLGKLVEVWINSAEGFGVASKDIYHAGAAETAILLAEKEELVRKERIKEGYHGPIPGKVLLSKGYKAFSDNGTFGNPKKASKELGRKIIEKTVEYYVRTIKEELEAKG